MQSAAEALASFPRPLTAYPDASGESLIRVLYERVQAEPFNAVATAIFLLAILHTFAAARFTRLSHDAQHAHDERARAEGRPLTPGVWSETLHFFGEVEVVFGLWAIVLFAAIVAYTGWEAAKHYLNDTVNYTEPLFVVVIMALAATRPIVRFAEAALRKVANLWRGTPAAWWCVILIIGPVLGSVITEPAAMTISALVLGRQFFDLQPSTKLKYATLGLLFVNVSIGGTLTHFAAPPVLMVARPWAWDTLFMLGHFGWRAMAAILAATFAYFLIFRREFRDLATRGSAPDVEEPDDQEFRTSGLLPVPRWITATHMGFMAWTVLTAHYPALFLGGFLIFLGFARATTAYQSRIELKAPLLVGFFLAGLVIHGGLQAWWIAPVLASLSDTPLFLSSAVLTTVNDNALITFLATLVPNLDDHMKIAVVQGAVTGGGLTVIANAPNPAGQALLSRFFGGAIAPIGLFLGALVPTVIAALAFRLL
jgi:hypothetical protein